ncbi:MAG TPA: TIM barrel protein [Candidatus Didemnitutus sp.]|nr:TIM barrel protein [Candidatus Didemnitutus sp.]
MLHEIAGLGFEWVELSHGIRITLVPGVLKAIEEGVIKVSSCHNFCPLPTGVQHAAPNLYMPTATDSRERDQWLRHSKRTMDFAQQVRAKRVVMHLGRVEFFWFNPAKKIERYLAQEPAAGRENDAAYQKLLTAGLAKMNERKVAAMERIRTGLAGLFPYATEKGVALGLENREAFDELPLDADFAGLLAGMANAPVGYWHDTGHAQIKENMGLLKHCDHLVQNASRAIGFHLHDVSAEGRDHQPVGSGKIDFEMISEFWRPEHALVIELGPRVSRDEVLRSKERIDALVARRFG